MKQHQRVVGSSSTDDADDDLESPRNFLNRRAAVEALPDSDSPAAGAAAVKARAVRSSSITARAVAFEGVKPLRLERLHIADAGGGDSSSADAAAPGSAFALGAGAISGLRSARFAPKVRASPHRAQTARPDVSSSFAPPPVAAAAAAAPASERPGDDGDSSAECGNLHVFVLHGPRYPRGAGGAWPPVDRAFFEGCVEARTPGGAAARWPAHAAPPAHARFFCFPLGIIDRLRAGASDAYGFTFSFTAEDGSIRWGCAVTGADPGAQGESAADAAAAAVSVAVLCDWPLLKPLTEFAKQSFLLEQKEGRGWANLAPNVAALARGLREGEHEVGFLMRHPLWLPAPLTPLLEMLHGKVESFVVAFAAALLEAQMLLISDDVAKLLPAAAALSHLLSPLSFAGIFIPFLPACLHLDPATLINHTPTPFIIGIERHALARVAPLAPHLVVVDLDAGTIAGGATAEMRDAAAKVPLLTRLASALEVHAVSSSRRSDDATAAAGGGGGGGGGERAAYRTESGRPDERGMQAALLAFMRDLLGGEPALRASGDADDAARAVDMQVADELAADVLRATADLAAASTVSKRVLMCRADAFVRALGGTGRRPPTSTSAFLAEAYQCGCTREFLLTPTGGASGGTFGDAAWLAGELDTSQSIDEHAAALDAVHAQVAQRLSSACSELRDAGLLSPRTANYQSRFEVGVNEVLLDTFPCALHYMGGLRAGVLYVSTGHLCFETSTHAAANAKLPLARITGAEKTRDPVFHLFANSIRVLVDDGAALHFTSFEHRDEALALIKKVAGGSRGPLE